MSKKNKANPGQYTQAGRLTQDDVARRREKQDLSVGSERTGSGQKAAPTGISNRESAAQEREERERFPRDDDESGSPDEGTDRRDVPVDSENEQASSKSGARSSPQKAADSKYVDRPHPASEKVDGAFGREPNR